MTDLVASNEIVNIVNQRRDLSHINSITVGRFLTGRAVKTADGARRAHHLARCLQRARASVLLRLLRNRFLQATTRTYYWLLLPLPSAMVQTAESAGDQSLSQRGRVSHFR